MNDFAGDANASAAVEWGIILGIIALVVVLTALVLGTDILTLLSEIGVFLVRIIRLLG